MSAEGSEIYGPAPSTAADREPTPAPAWVYLLRCPDGSLYGGWTNDLARRLKAHRSGKGGAKYTKSHGRDAVRLAYAEKCADKSAALKREAALKKLPKAEKEALAEKWAADNKITLRMATPDDAAAVCALYNWYVRHGVQTFQYTPSTVEEYRENIAHTLQNAPFLLAESADGRLQGFACAHLWHEREAYAWDVETTAYCAPDCIGQGVGGRLYRALIALERNRYCSFIGKYTRKGLETVSFFTFLEEKITEILFQLFFLAVVAFLLIFYGVDTLFVVSLVILFISIQGLFQWCLYRKKRNVSQHIIDLVDGLEETYYIADVLPKPKEFQNKAY